MKVWGIKLKKAEWDKWANRFRAAGLFKSVASARDAYKYAGLGLAAARVRAIEEWKEKLFEIEAVTGSAPSSPEEEVSPAGTMTSTLRQDSTHSHQNARGAYDLQNPKVQEILGKVRDRRTKSVKAAFFWIYDSLPLTLDMLDPDEIPSTGAFGHWLSIKQIGLPAIKAFHDQHNGIGRMYSKEDVAERQAREEAKTEELIGMAATIAQIVAKAQAESDKLLEEGGEGGKDG